MDDAADDPTIIYSLHAADICRQMRLDPLPLLIAHPERFLRMIPIPSKNESESYSQLSRINEF
jgi:hypothetical protein